MAQGIDPAAIAASLDDAWSPLTIATVNDYDVRVARADGAFAWHAHPDTDEFFLVLRGTLRIELDGDEVTLGPGEVFVVPRGSGHRPFSGDGADILLFEPSSTVNTGDSPGALTAARRVF